MLEAVSQKYNMLLMDFLFLVNFLCCTLIGLGLLTFHFLFEGPTPTTNVNVSYKPKNMITFKLRIYFIDC